MGDIEKSLAEVNEGYLVLRHPKGIIRISTEPLRWWSEIDHPTLLSFADRLATMAEESVMLMAATDTGDFLKESEEKIQRRNIEVFRLDEEPKVS